MNKIETVYDNGHIYDNEGNIRADFEKELKDLAAQSGMDLTAIQVPMSASSRIKDTLAAWKDTRTLLSPYDYGYEPKVYYQPRYPSKPPMIIVEEALELLNSKKHLGIKKIELSKEFGPIIRLIISSDASAERPDYSRVLSVCIDYKAFDRTYDMETDKEAGLMTKLDTDTYIKLRLAFLINKALKIVSPPDLLMDSCTFKVISSYDTPATLI